MKDNEWAGVGNHYDYGMRMYDPRICRPPSVDPLTQKYPWLSPYQFYSDNPIRNIDIDGMEGAAVSGGGINWGYIYSPLGIRGNDAASGKDYANNVVVPAMLEAGKSTLGLILLGTPGMEEEGVELEATTIFAEDATRVAHPFYEPEPIVESPGGAQVKTPNTSTVRQNAKSGADFEKQTSARLSQTDDNVVDQITVKTQSGTKTRIDHVSTDRNTGAIKLTESKASNTAPLRKNQKLAHPEIEESGGTVVGKGKPPYVGGTKIPPTKVNVVRPNE